MCERALARHRVEETQEMVCQVAYIYEKVRAFGPADRTLLYTTPNVCFSISIMCDITTTQRCVRLTCPWINAELHDDSSANAGSSSTTPWYLDFVLATTATAGKTLHVRSHR